MAKRLTLLTMVKEVSGTIPDVKLVFLCMLLGFVIANIFFFGPETNLLFYFDILYAMLFY